MTGFAALFGLRWSCFIRRARRNARYLRLFLDWQAIIIYLYAAATFLGGPLYYLLVPDQIPVPIRQVGATLLTFLLVAVLGAAGYRALFKAADGFGGNVPTGDIPFVLVSPVSPMAYMADRLVWGLMQYLAQGALVLPAVWLLGRAFLSPWGWGEAASIALRVVAVQMGALATSLLLYGLPRWVSSVLRLLRAGLWVLTGLGTVAGLAAAGLLQRSLALPRPAARLGAITELAPVPGSAAGIVQAVLPVALVWAAAATLLTLALARPGGDRLAADILEAERNRQVRHSGERVSPSAPGLARASMGGWWGQGTWAVAWRQLAAYRHLPLAAWPPKLLSLLGVLGASFFMGFSGADGGRAGAMASGDPATVLPMLIPAMVAIAAGAGLMASWRREVKEGLTRLLHPIRSSQLVVGFALWPALVLGAVGGIGTLLSAWWNGWSVGTALAALLVALAAGPVLALLAMVEEAVAATALVGTDEGRMAGKVASIVLTGGAILLGAKLVSVLGPGVGLALTAVLLMAEACGLGMYLGFRLDTERR